MTEERMLTIPIIHDDECELDIRDLALTDRAEAKPCHCLAREADWLAEEGATLAQNEWIARIVTGTLQNRPLKRGPEWQAKWDAYHVRKDRLTLYLKLRDRQETSQ